MTKSTINAHNGTGKWMNITASCRTELAHLIKMDAIINRISISELVERILENRYANTMTIAKSMMPKL